MQLNLKKINPNFFYAGLVILAFMVWMGTGLFTSNDTAPETSTTAQTETTPTVKTSTISPNNYTRILSLSAQTEARYRSTMSAQTAGRITVLNVENGSAVKKGQHLATIDAAERRTQLLSAKASLAAATKLADSARTLIKDGYISTSILAEREAAEAEAKARVKNINQDLAYTRITAPIDGIIENRRVSVGDLASVGTPLLDIVNREALLLTAFIPQKDRARVTVGQNIDATLITGEKIEGTVDFIATDADTSTRTYKVTMAVDGNRYPIPTGMSANVHIPTETVAAYTIPHSAAILGDDGTLGVMLADDNTAVFKKITILEDTTDALIVTFNTPRNTPLVIITRGQLSLTSGTNITLE